MDVIAHLTLQSDPDVNWREWVRIIADDGQSWWQMRLTLDSNAEWRRIFDKLVPGIVWREYRRSILKSLPAG